MLKNYIKIAWRNLLKHKIDSTISIGGLAIGLACCILLVFYVRFEWSYDNFHENADCIYRITDERTDQESAEVYKSLITPYPLSVALDSTFPEIDRVMDIIRGRVHVESKDKFVPEVVTFAGSGFFEAFSFPLLYGDAETALSSPDNIVLTEKAALRLFGEKQVVGKTLNVRLNEEVYIYIVSAVAKTVPANSSIQFEMILPFESYFRSVPPEQRADLKENWYIGFGETWVRLNKRTSPKQLEAKFPQLLKTHLGDFAKARKMKLGLQPLSEAYFDQEFTSRLTGNSNILYSVILGGIALVILAIAGMNFMSLALSRAAIRGHEMGIRKAAGAKSQQIGFRVFGEVLITCGIAFALGMVLAELGTPVFQQITGKQFQINIFGDPVLWLLLIGMLLMVTLITGGYPAFRMSRKKAVQLFSSQRTAEGIPLFVKGLICVQFALSIAFLIGTFVMNHQLSYLLNKDLGFSTSNVLTVELNMEGEDNARIAEVFSQEARRLPVVQSVSVTDASYRLIPEFIQGRHGFGMGNMGSSTTLEGFDNIIQSEMVDEHFLKTLDIELIKGRNFSVERPSEIKNGIIVNEEFAETMGWEHPVGQVIVDKNARWTPPFDGKKVIGVMNNYHFDPLYTQLQPIALQHIDSRDYASPGTILIKTAPGSLSSIIDQLSSLWNEVAPEEVFRYRFLDNLVAAQYRDEQRWKSIIQFASFMAIILACLGLFGLSALAARQRTKEIGIRKVLGATVASIVGLLSGDFLKLVIIGFLIATPVAWYGVHHWLQDFAYKIEIDPGVFVLAGGVALLIALATISWQSVRAALANPVESLRSE